MAFKMKPFSGFGNSPMKNKKNFEKFQAQKQKAKDFVEKLKPQIKKKPIGTLGRLARIAGRASFGGGVGAILSLGYEAYKAGQKKSGGKINPNQKSIIKEGKKKIDKSKFKFPINRKFSIYNKKI